MELKPEASLPAISVGVERDNGASSSAPSPKYKEDNFFDFASGTDTDIWGPTFTKTLRKTRLVHPALH